MLQATRPAQFPNLLVLDSRKAILDLAPLLESLAERCGQPGAMNWLRYFLDPAVMGRRNPYLVLLLRPEETGGKSLSVGDVEAAALLFEYRALGLRTGAIAHARSAQADAAGFSSVIAPRGERTRVATIAARALIERGASIVLTTYEGAEEANPGSVLAGWTGVLSASRRREVCRTLRLGPTLDATLARMGKNTRFNLRYYRRRLEREMRCEYLPDARAALAGVDLQYLNETSLNPVEPREFERRVRSASELPGSFLAGLRGADGQWLSLIGGWRQGGATVLYWQMNRAGFEKHSISTVMRSHFLESEITLGAGSLLIYGGTTHSMRHAFETEVVADLVVRRTDLKGSLLFWGSRLLLHGARFGIRPNFLADTLQDPTLQWMPSETHARPKVMPAFKPQVLGRTA